jgi:hypothetical protein
MVSNWQSRHLAPKECRTWQICNHVSLSLNRFYSISSYNLAYLTESTYGAMVKSQLSQSPCDIPSNKITFCRQYDTSVYTIKDPLWLNILPGEENMALCRPINNLHYKRSCRLSKLRCNSKKPNKQTNIKQPSTIN